MAEEILDGTGKSFRGKVDSSNRLWVDSRSASLQHDVSYTDESAFQVTGVANLASGTVVPLIITNNNQDKDVVITFVRHQVIGSSGGTAFPNASNYFAIRKGTSYSSGGSVATIENINVGSSVVSGVSCYQGAPTVTGTAADIDRWYTKGDGDMNSFNKEGALIIQPGQTIDLAYIGDQTSGIVYTRLSFILRKVPKDL